jgi:hypothetical protein
MLRKKEEPGCMQRLNYRAPRKLVDIMKNRRQNRPKSGLALRATIAGTKEWKDDKLNEQQWLAAMDEH